MAVGLRTGAWSTANCIIQLEFGPVVAEEYGRFKWRAARQERAIAHNELRANIFIYYTSNSRSASFKLSDLLRISQHFRLQIYSSLSFEFSKIQVLSKPFQPVVSRFRLVSFNWALVQTRTRCKCNITSHKANHLSKLSKWTKKSKLENWVNRIFQKRTCKHRPQREVC